jgi:regulator of sigma E protease
VEILLLSLIPTLDQLVNWGTVAVGLGLVIFFHELGHFAVAKWCDVYVERFSIGFGPILLRKKWGETEYALSAIPFGGYVKMLGQDDMDPSQMSSEEIAEDPRAYTAKGVLPRMAIISAGVIMNVITGLLFFLLAFRSGVEVTPAVVGDLQIGLPAWEAGLQTGDRITVINNRPIADFSDLMRATALSSGSLRVEGVRTDNSTFEYTLRPDESGTRRRIGVGPARGLEVVDIPSNKSYPSVIPGSAAASATPSIEPGDELIRVNGEELEDFAELSALLARYRDESVELTVRRENSAPDTEPQLVDITVPPAPFRVLGITTEFGRIAALRDDSPAASAGLQVGDRLIKVDDQDIGIDIDPLRLPDYFGSRHGEDVVVYVERSLSGGENHEFEARIVPENRPGWTEAPAFDNSALSVPSIGIAYHMVPTVLSVEEGGPAAQAGIRTSEVITRLQLIRPEGAAPDGDASDVIDIAVGETNWAHAFWKMQQFPQRDVKLTMQEAGSDQKRTVEITPVAADDWFSPSPRGIQLFALSTVRKADTVPAALAMGWEYTRNSVTDIYLTLQSLITQRLSVKELHGPLGIVGVASDVAEAGIVPFLVFLGFLSINLAVLNFLPIPLLDGGHMVFLLWEAIIRRKPPERVVLAASYAGLVFVLGLMITVLYVDLQRLWTGGS